MFFTASQNNTYGRFTVNNEEGVGHYIIIEADDYRTADRKLFEMEGVTNLGSCPCCGDRWYGVDEDGTDTPTVYGDDVVFVDDETANTFVHYTDGTIRGFKSSYR